MHWDSGELFKFGEGKKIQLIEVESMEEVLVNGQVYMSWASGDQLARRIAIVELYELEIASQEELAEAFGLHVNSVENYINVFRVGGMDALTGQVKGPKDAWKVTPEIKFLILEMAFRNRNISYEKISELLYQRWKKKISKNSIRQVLLENGFIQEEIKKNEGIISQGYLFEGNDDGQLKLEFPVIKQNKERISDDQHEQVKENEVGYNIESIKNKDKSYYSRSGRIYLDQLEQGEYSVYGGGLLLVPLLERYNFVPTIKRILDIETYEGYSLEELCLTLFYFDLFGFRSIENFKTVYPEEFGILIGKLNNPSIRTLRRFLYRVRELKRGERLIEEFGKEYLESGLVKWGVLYIDGHFLPYYGIYCISMGMHGVRKIPMKGSYNFIGVDEKFNPWIFLIRSSREDLLKKIPEMILKAKDLAKEVGISEDDVKNLTVIFDREGYSAELFRILDGKESENGKFKVIFITWAKYSDRWVDDIEDEKFDKSLKVTYEIQKPKEHRYFETDHNMNKYGKIRTIVVERVKDKKRMAIYTNAEKSEMESERIVQLICRRWGEEDLIKELLMKHLINYSPGYVIEDMEEQPMVDNPKLDQLKQKRTNFKSELSELKKIFGEEVLDEMDKKKESANWDEIKKKSILTIADIQSIRSKMTLLNQQICNLPEEVRYDEAHNGKKLVEFDYEKKRFLDCIKIFTYNIEKKMCELLTKYYNVRNVKKEIWPALAMIVRRGAYIKLEQRKLIVRLRRFKNPEIDYAARHLCEDLNQMGPVTLDKFRFPIHYEVL